MSDVSYRYKASELAGRRAIQDDVTGEVTFVGDEPPPPPVIKRPTPAPKAKSGKE